KPADDPRRRALSELRPGVQRGGEPLLPGGPSEVFDAGAVPGKQRRADGVPALGERFADRQHLRRRAGEAVEQQAADASTVEAKRPRALFTAQVDGHFRRGSRDQMAASAAALTLIFARPLSWLSSAPIAASR